MSLSRYDVDRINKAVDYMENHLEDTPDVAAVARAAHCSKYHFHRIFSESLGLTVHGYMVRRRLTEAARELTGTRKPILHIALAGGYGSQQAFTDAFTAMYKKPPNRFRRDAVFYPLQLPLRLDGEYAGLLSESGRGGGSRAGHWRAVPAGHADTGGWMDLVRLVVGGFPNLQEEDYSRSLRESIRSGQAFILRDGPTAAGILMLCREAGSIDFMAIHPLYRHAGIDAALLDQADRAFHRDRREISITTFRAGDKADTGQRETYAGLGFREADLLTEFGYPTQRFVLKRKGKKRKR
ncbi:MAG: GNAT family N-acetyltransferase [Planctomycetaceae bacterium]|nr:GNAT family N-acetyltransferase [Planctomycetaceae bacterium]